MSIAVNGQSQVPPGFRFHPTEEELLGYYLRKKVANEPIELDVIREIDLNRKEPWDIQEECRIGSGPQNDWYLFSHKDRKYPTGTRTNRATTAGFWKATGRDKAIRGPGGRDGSGRRIGMRKTLVFYTGRAPHGCKSDWIMHEYRLEDEDEDKEGEDSADRGAKGQKFERPDDCGCGAGEDSAGQESDGWVICRVFKKKNFFQQASSKVATTARSGRSHEEEITKPLPPRYHTMDIDVVQEPRRPSKIEASARSKTPVAALFDDGFGAIMDIPALESPVSEESPELVTPPTTSDKNAGSTGQGWAVVDRLIASHLDGAHPEIPTYLDGDRCPEQGYGTYKADGAGLGYPDVCSSHGGPDPDLWLLLQSSTWSLT